MATVVESLRGVNAYPIPTATIESVVMGRGLVSTDECTAEMLQSANYQLAVADLLDWLSKAPNVSQGGQSYSISEKMRTELKAESQSLIRKYGGSAEVKPIYGYKGSRL